MSVDARDHRRFLEGKLKDADKVAAERQKPLVEQRPVAKETGDARLDKMLRAIEALRETAATHATAVALKGIGCVQDDMLRLQQMEFFYTQGQKDAFEKVALLPAQIILEEAGS